MKISSVRLFPVALTLGASALAFNLVQLTKDAPWAVKPAQAATPSIVDKEKITQGTASAAGAQNPDTAGTIQPVLPVQAVASTAGPESRSEAQLLRDLNNKRPNLDSREKQLELRERLLEAAEKRVDGKISELRALEARLKQLTGVQEEQANKQFLSLVKVYETMKPKDAAKVFEKLDMTVQIAVASRMKEAKMAAILSQMTPDSAKQLTMELANKAKLPS